MLFVIKAAIKKVTASIRSGITLKFFDSNFSTPSIIICLVPKPDKFAPIEIRNFPKFTISGSFAALFRIVLPLAKHPAIIKFAVPVTDTGLKSNSQPINSRALA